MKTGIDILEIKRVSSQKVFLNKIFSESEQRYFKGFSNPKERICGFFCAKEAVFKALDASNFSYLDIEILHKSTGRPFVILKNNLKIEFEKNYKDIDISISHSKTIATAICIVS